MTNWININLPTFKDTYGSYDNYLLEILRSSGTIKQTDFDAKKVTGGFVSSDIFLLHDGLYKKTLATAFHIPNKEGIIHHFNIHLVRFKRADTKNEWGIECVKDITNDEVGKLREFISKQYELIGKKIEKKYVKVVTTDSPYILDNLQDILDRILSLDEKALGELSDDGYTKLTDLIGKLLDKGSVLVNKKLYLQLKKSRLSPKSVKKYEKDLKDFRDLIDSDTTIETDMQDFLENRVWLFGLNYQQSHRRSKPKFTSSTGPIYDFLLESFNEIYDIAELKSPNDRLIEQHSEGERKNAFNDRIDYRYSVKFSRALHQVIDYIQEFESSFPQIKENQPNIRDFLYPKGTIVISKRALFPKTGKDSSKYLHLLNRQFSNIEILTYDDLADRGQIIIDFINGIKGDSDL